MVAELKCGCQGKDADRLDVYSVEKARVLHHRYENGEEKSELDSGYMEDSWTPAPIVNIVKVRCSNCGKVLFKDETISKG